MIVTAYYDLYNKPDRFWTYYGLFFDLAASGLPIVLFTDPSLVPKFRFLPPTVHVVPAPLHTMELYQIAALYQGALPEHRNAEKDTQAFLGLQNTKIEFVKRAKDLFPAVKTWAWLDFGYLKVCKAPDAVPRVLATLEEILAASYDKVYLPGIWPQGHSFSVHRVHWRFCGGFFVVPATLVDWFYAHSRTVLRDFTTHPSYCLTWETGVWCLIELCAEDRHLIQWYAAGDHDERMVLNIPRGTQASPLDPLANRYTE